jgi:hypothetical protein
MPARPDAAPFAPGEAPFHIKGVAYTRSLAYIDGRVLGGRAAVLGALVAGDAALRRFFEQPFLASAWYDVFPLVALFGAAARRVSVPSVTFLREVSRHQASEDIHGIYRFMLKLVSPERIIERLPRVAAQYFDFVTAEVRKLGARSYESIGHGVPAPLLDLYMAVTENFLLVALETAGAKNPRNIWSPSEPEGEAHGLLLMQTRRELTWEA